MSIRQQKIIKQLKKCLSEYFIRESEAFSQVPIISRIDISKDLRNANIYLFVYETVEKTEVTCKQLNKLQYSIHQYMIKTTAFRVLPKLRFIADKDQKEMDDVRSILNNL
jgi:ribosome-binding factor A